MEWRESRGVLRPTKPGSCSRCGLTDFKKLNASQMASEDVFYRLLAATLARQTKFAYDFGGERLEMFGANMNLESFLRELLDAAEGPLVWCMDEVDKLFSAPLRQRLLRAGTLVAQLARDGTGRLLGQAHRRDRPGYRGPPVHPGT